MVTQIRFRCYYCHRVHTVESSAAGKKGRCPCGKLMVVPRPQSADDGPEPPPVLPQATPPAAGDSDPLGIDVDITAKREGPPSIPSLEPTETDPELSPPLMQEIPPEESEGGMYEEPAKAGGGLPRVIGSLPVLGAATVHAFGNDLGVTLPVRPDFLSLPAVLWSALLFSLGGLLLLDGGFRLLGMTRKE